MVVSAEELVFEDNHATASRTTSSKRPSWARNMVGVWGMSDVIGPVAVITEDDHVPIPGASDISPVTQQLVDEEVRHVIENAHEQVIEKADELKPPQARRACAGPTGARDARTG